MGHTSFPRNDGPEVTVAQWAISPNSKTHRVSLKATHPNLIQMLALVPDLSIMCGDVHGPTGRQLRGTPDSLTCSTNSATNN